MLRRGWRIASCEQMQHAHSQVAGWEVSLGTAEAAKGWDRRRR